MPKLEKFILEMSKIQLICAKYVHLDKFPTHLLRGKLSLSTFGPLCFRFDVGTEEFCVHFDTVRVACILVYFLFITMGKLTNFITVICQFKKDQLSQCTEVLRLFSLLTALDIVHDGGY